MKGREQLDALLLLHEEIGRLRERAEQLKDGLQGVSTKAPQGRPRKLSIEAQKAISEASDTQRKLPEETVSKMRASWTPERRADYSKRMSEQMAIKHGKTPGGDRLTPEGRKRLSEKTKQTWAAAKAAGVKFGAVKAESKPTEAQLQRRRENAAKRRAAKLGGGATAAGAGE